MLPNFAQLCHQHVAKKLSACCHKYNYNVVANTSACCHLEVDISHISSAQLLAERRNLQDIIVKIVVVKFSVGTDIIISSSQNYEKYHDQNRALMPQPIAVKSVISSIGRKGTKSCYSTILIFRASSRPSPFFSSACKTVQEVYLLGSTTGSMISSIGKAMKHLSVPGSADHQVTQGGFGHMARVTEP